MAVGIRLVVRGSGEGYYNFIRNSATKLPWQYYQKEISVTEEWSKLRIPWEEFIKGDDGDPGKLKVN